MNFPVSIIEDNKFKVIADLSLYAKDAVVSACYKFTDHFYVHQQLVDNKVEVIFEAKDGSTVTDVVVKQFCNELIDQQVRHNMNLQFGHIRDLIVEEAFKPVNK